jgi:hypothetical protein
MSGFRRSLQTMKRNWCPLGNEYQLYPNNTPDGGGGIGEADSRNQFGAGHGKELPRSWYDGEIVRSVREQEE